MPLYCNFIHQKFYLLYRTKQKKISSVSDWKKKSSGWWIRYSWGEFMSFGFYCKCLHSTIRWYYQLIVSGTVWTALWDGFLTDVGVYAVWRNVCILEDRVTGKLYSLQTKVLTTAPFLPLSCPLLSLGDCISSFTTKVLWASSFSSYVLTWKLVGLLDLRPKNVCVCVWGGCIVVGVCVCVHYKQGFSF